VGGNSLGIPATVIDDCYYLDNGFPPRVIFNILIMKRICELARLARVSMDQVWINDPPDFLIPLLLDNVTSIWNK
jgi:hypothetical protein